MNRLIIFLIRRRLRLKKYEMFRFANQKSKAVYYFTETNVMKTHNEYTHPSRVSLNHLLSDECQIIHLADDDYTKS